MCGIAGYTQFETRFGDQSLLRKMGEKIRHRGPDASDIYYSHEVGLAHQRLSIIDLSTAGTQPMSSHDGRYTIVFNGEIYNFQVLREELIKKGYPFRTKTDTEVILALYEKMGESVVNDLNGMFAFAIWDKIEKSLFLARDRLGKKPLYYYRNDSDIAFASEIKALLEIPSITRNVREDAMYDYFVYQYIPDPKTIFSNIFKLEPGHCMTVRSNKICIKKYWDISFSNIDYRSEEEISEELYELAERSTLRRLVSDVPLGAFLSGGIDSSGIVGLMANNSSNPVTTCSIGFNNKKFNEVEFARIVADKYHTKHHELYVHENVKTRLEEIAWFFDEPFSDPSLVPTYFVSELAKQKVTVALAGDGGDEIFAGYEKYSTDAIENRIRNLLPEFIRKTISPSFSFLSESNNVLFKKAGTLLNTLSISPDVGFFLSNAQITKRQWNYLIKDSIRTKLDGYHPEEITVDAYNKADAEDHLSKILYTDIKTFLPGDILVKADRMSMAHSLEVRAPLLDYEIVEYAARIPSSLKLHKGSKKYILKQAFNKLLPEDILNRKKMGFSVPLADWLKTEFNQLFESRVLNSESGISNYFKIKNIQAIWHQHNSNGADHSAQLWSLLMFQLWWDNYMDTSSQYNQ